MKRAVTIVMVVFMVVFFSSAVFAACTKDDVVAQVDKVAAELEKQGEAYYAEVPKIRFCGSNYVYVMDTNATILAHGFMPHLVGKCLIGIKDDTGYKFFVDLMSKLKASTASKGGKTYYNGTGWVTYRWPTPDDKTKFQTKTVYAKCILLPDGKNVVVCAGMTVK